MLHVAEKKLHSRVFALLLALLAFSSACYAQTGNEVIAASAEKISRSRKNTAFSKAIDYYRQENWDSVLVFSMKQLNNNVSATAADYCHYFRASGFRNKQLHDNALHELKKISPSFRYGYMARIGIGEILLEKGAFSEALRYFSEQEQLVESGKTLVRRSSFLHNTGLCYFHLQRYEKAETYLLRAFALREEEKDSSGMIASHMDIGNLYYGQYNDRAAIDHFRKAYELSRIAGNFELKHNAALNMAVVEENRKHFEDALHYRKESEKWTDSLNDQRKIWAIAELEKKFALRQKQKQLDVLRANNRLKIAERNTFLYSSILLVALLLTVAYFYRQKVLRSRIILEQKNKLDELNAAKDRLFSIVSHDLRSSVQALKTNNSSLIASLEDNNYKELDATLQHNRAIANSTFNLLDNLLHWALLQTEQFHFFREQHRLFHLVEQVSYNYKPLMAEKNIAFSNTIPASVNVFADAESIKLVLRNLIDNAIRFSPEHGTISVYVLSENTNEALCSFAVEDTGEGMDDRNRQKLLRGAAPSPKQSGGSSGTGLGLQLCKSMILKNRGAFNIESQPGKGTKIIVSLPKQSTHG